MRKFVIILAGGIGSRFGSSLSKQYEMIAKKPILVWTIDRYLDSFPIENIIVVVNQHHSLIWRGVIREYPHMKDLKTVIGGSQRFHSVQNALCKLGCEKDDLIGVHDGVRPFVSEETIRIAFSTAAVYGSAVPVFDSVNTLRIKSDSANHAIDRATVVQVQNPQVFRSDILKKAYLQSYQPHFLDDATVVEADGNKIQLCKGNYENIKITHPQDMYIAEGLLQLYYTNLSNNGTLRHNEKSSVV